MRRPGTFSYAGRVLVFLALLLGVVHAQTTEFTYQGSLKSGDAPANGNYDFEFALYDALAGGAQVGSTIGVNNVGIANGIFSVKLDFGNQFAGATRFLEIRVRPAGQPGITILSPRQSINSSPYSVKSLSADAATNATNAINATNASSATTAATATNALQLGGVAANQFVVTGDARLSDARNPLPNSANYIQNTTSQQTSSNFNISGTGSAESFNAAAQYNLGGNRVLSVAGANNLFAGVGAGQANTTGQRNAFFGRDAGYSNSEGFQNAFFGYQAGYSNTTGVGNVFFGDSAGWLNSTGGGNAFLGFAAGASNTMGHDNAFFGNMTGQVNSTGNYNAFFGAEAGRGNTEGNFNAFFGVSAGLSNTTGNNNTFLGQSSGISNYTGRNNTIIGGSANVGAGGLMNATAIGARAFATQNNSLVLGSINGINGCGPLTFCDSVNVGIGTTSPADKLDVNGIIRVATLGVAGSTSLCQNASNQISTCSSSARYKTNINPFGSGLELIRKLRPVSFNWKEGGMRDMGLVAEEVAEIEPLLTTTNARGEIEGVKYDRLGVVLVKAVNEQQKIIEQQQLQIEKQQRQITELTNLVCLSNKDAEICKEEPK